jgi:hypothetical protein
MAEPVDSSDLCCPARSYEHVQVGGRQQYRGSDGDPAAARRADEDFSSLASWLQIQEVFLKRIGNFPIRQDWSRWPRARQDTHAILTFFNLWLRGSYGEAMKQASECLLPAQAFVDAGCENPPKRLPSPRPGRQPG